jgi:hypothetical protein
VDLAPRVETAGGLQGGDSDKVDSRRQTAVGPG